ncbi:hypothetical protein [Marixanthomonas spongiae]|nr:hypothetical protein [Marixanthomonas spongiae]
MKQLTLLFFTLFFCGYSYAQVGIGTTNPDPSSMLDIQSDSQGLLAPRMDTAARNAIANPAESLLVFDTDEDAFYYYDTAGTKWVKLLTNNVERDNYVLVKDETDFPTSGTLDENTYYEINGTITLTKSINLNNAYVSGMDANEDILSFPGGTVFKGTTTGGSIRNVTLKGDKAFEITGPGITQGSLLVQNTIIDGMSTSVGSISGFGLYFGNIVQFKGNKGGITYSNIGNLLLNNQAWLDTNEGTFETFSGNFGLIEKVSGFSSVNGGDVALDVSDASLNVTTGVLQGTVFSGGGDFVSGYAAANTYPGYNFSVDWEVNAPGIPRESDDVGNASMYYQGTAASTTLNSNGTKISVSTTASNLLRFSHGNNELIYKGKEERVFDISGSLSYNSSGVPELVFYILKKTTSGNSALNNTKVFSKGSTGFFTDSGTLAIPLTGTVSLKPDESIEVWVQGGNSSSSINIRSLNLSIN